MDANKFFKKHGLAEVKILLTSPSHGFFFKEDFYKHYGFDIYDDLKRLVESHELVVVWRMPESWRNEYDGDILGLEGAKMYLEMHEGHELVGHELERFKQAIADVESCQ